MNRNGSSVPLQWFVLPNMASRYRSFNTTCSTLEIPQHVGKHTIHSDKLWWLLDGHISGWWNLVNSPATYGKLGYVCHIYYLPCKNIVIALVPTHGCILLYRYMHDMGHKSITLKSCARTLHGQVWNLQTESSTSKSTLEVTRLLKICWEWLGLFFPDGKSTTWGTYVGNMICFFVPQADPRICEQFFLKMGHTPK
jgi:hypothetical protein